MAPGPAWMWAVRRRVATASTGVRREGCSENCYEVVEVPDVPTVVVVELGDVGAEPPAVVVVVLGLVVDGGTVVVVVLLGLVVVVELVVVVDFGGGVVVVVVVVVVSWETGVELDARGGYSRYRAPNPRKATAMRAVERRTRSRRCSGRLMKPRSPFRFGRSGRSGRGTFARFVHMGRSRRLASNGFVPSSSVTAPSSFLRPWGAS
jgi:hypothetical protein